MQHRSSAWGDAAQVVCTAWKESVGPALPSAPVMAMCTSWSITTCGASMADRMQPYASSHVMLIYAACCRPYLQ